MIPSSQRPYVGSSQNNSELSLALGYNCISRLLGSVGGGGGGGGTAPTGSTGSSSQMPSQGGTSSGTMQPPSQTTNSSSSSSSSNSGSTSRPSGVPGGGMNGAGGGAGGAFNIGTVGPLRLLIEPLGEQIGWLLPMALLAMVAVAWQKKIRLPLERKQQSLVLWGVWLLTMGIFFSAAGFFHEYYLTVIVPAVCALFG
jgi:4-amino-4-deoxy-L-arabinose transferase-like glycosyltransferase